MSLSKESTVNFLKLCQRVLHVSRKPDRSEYFNVAKITGIGVIIIGVVGFVVSMIAQLLGQ
ncbi:protein translocase SEC61 complex subunit gamma [Methanobacterium congolense]|mgnify:FL=1|jgi:protein transport protein SEC61 subunit gamma-like protein|uniref:Protein translocase subunit SecE n=1 Tax=Methanobacterium congolense TaxID=118062 RepID=A0A1D3L0B3_9EURY|nr:protein translocase SEC61 complex subunit gamma [Methanobacterium congolense]SCG84988.1 Preprotein translocase subunit secE [Methanobacterium congolense]